MIRLRKKKIIWGMYKEDDNKYCIGYNDFGFPNFVDRDTLISEFIWIGLSEKDSEKLVKTLDKEYKKRK